MIQRIQTLFLIVAAGLIASLFACNMIRFSDGVTTIKYIEYPPTLILTLVSFVLSVVTIVSYKKRIFQIRLCNLNSLILFGYQVLLVVKFIKRDDSAIFSVTALFPIVAAVLTFIAMRYIARDEAMVLASTRLRSSKKKK
jgi:hypothetical protein